MRPGFRTEIWDNPIGGSPPMLFAERHEGPAVPTVLIYGHGDVVAGYDGQWKGGRSPWQVTADGDRSIAAAFAFCPGGTTDSSPAIYRWEGGNTSWPKCRRHD